METDRPKSGWAPRIQIKIDLESKVKFSLPTNYTLTRWIESCTNPETLIKPVHTLRVNISILRKQMGKCFCLKIPESHSTRTNLQIITKTLYITKILALIIARTKNQLVLLIITIFICTRAAFMKFSINFCKKKRERLLNPPVRTRLSILITWTDRRNRNFETFWLVLCNVQSFFLQRSDNRYAKWLIGQSAPWTVNVRHSSM